MEIMEVRLVPNQTLVLAIIKIYSDVKEILDMSDKGGRQILFLKLINRIVLKIVK